MNQILTLGVIIGLGLLLARLLERIGSPHVLSYILAGVLVSAVLGKVLPSGFVRAGDTVGTVALGFIAFMIGDTFRWQNVKEVGARGLWLSTVQALATFLLVLGGFIALEAVHVTHLPHALPVSLFLAATATATAPAATFMVVRQYKAKGPLTNYLLMAVTFDDAVGIVLFDISIVVMRILLRGGAISVGEMVLAPLREILLSGVIGAAAGLLMVGACRLFRNKSERLVLAIAAVLLTVGVCQMLNLSSLLSCMVMGTVFVNLVVEPEPLFGAVDIWTGPLLLLFFVLSGADIDLALIPKYAVVAACYVVLRTIGKVGGSWLGATWVHAGKVVQRDLGWAMLPQAGVAIGFAVMARSLFPELSYLSTIVLAIVVVFEIIGPLGAKAALFRSGEVGEEFRRTVRPKS
jgi:Kef-type K+ transport system membrane component KefB